MLVCECVWVQVTFKMHTHLIVCSTMNYIGVMGWPHPQPAPAQYFARWSVCVESIVNNVCECGCSILSSAPKNEMLSNWPLIVFVFSLRDLGHPDPLLLPVTHTHAHTNTHTHAQQTHWVWFDCSWHLCPCVKVLLLLLWQLLGTVAIAICHPPLTLCVLGIHLIFLFHFMALLLWSSGHWPGALCSSSSTWFSDLSDVMRLLCGHLFKTEMESIDSSRQRRRTHRLHFSASSSSSSDYIVHIWISVGRLFYYSFSDLFSHWNRFYVHSLKCRSYSLLTFYSCTTTTTTTTRTTTDHALH